MTFLERFQRYVLGTSDPVFKLVPHDKSIAPIYTSSAQTAFDWQMALRVSEVDVYCDTPQPGRRYWYKI